VSAPDRDRVLESATPVDPVRTLRFHKMGRGDGTYRVGEGWIAFAARTPEGPVAVRFDALEPERIRYRGWGPGAAYADARAEWLLGFDDDPEAFDITAGGTAPRAVTKRLRRMVEEQKGLRLGRMLSLFDCLLRVVLQQRVTWIEATGAKKYLTRHFGEEAPHPELRLPARPEVLAQQPYYELHPAGIERSRADAIRKLAKRHEAIDAIAALPFEEAKAALFALPGVGGWTVGMTAGFGMGDPDAVPVGDYHLPNLICHFLAGEPRGDDRRMLQLLAPWKGQRFRLIRLLYGAGVGPERRGPKMSPSAWTRDSRH
tara:strand:- start:2947 stop:3891 length:945 start_codon:yes stop_codon:yes gene_type:complete